MLCHVNIFLNQVALQFFINLYARTWFFGAVGSIIHAGQHSPPWYMSAHTGCEVLWAGLKSFHMIFLRRTGMPSKSFPGPMGSMGALGRPEGGLSHWGLLVAINVSLKRAPGAHGPMGPKGKGAPGGPSPEHFNWNRPLRTFPRPTSLAFGISTHAFHELSPRTNRHLFVSADTLTSLEQFWPSLVCRDVS